MNYNKLDSLTWTNGLSVAIPMLMAGIRLGQDGMRTPGHSAYLTGQAMYYLLKAYQFEKRSWAVSTGSGWNLSSRFWKRWSGEKLRAGVPLHFLGKDRSRAGVWCLRRCVVSYGRRLLRMVDRGYFPTGRFT